MKKLLPLFFIFSYSLGFSQAYDNLLSNESHWYVSSCGAFCVTDHYYAKGDTTINGKIYTFLNKYHYNKNMMLREDTAQRKIYFIAVGSSKETLLYDFSLTPGDSMEIENPISPLPPNAGWHTLDSIKLITLLDGVHRAFYLSENNGSNTATWIEGIGSLALINTPSSERDLNGAGDLTCFYKDGVKVYEADTLPTGECDTTLMVGINAKEIESNIASVYPIPAKNAVNIKVDILTTDRWNLEVYDVNGKLIFTQKLNKFITTINTVNWKNDIYFTKIYNKQKSLVQKIIISK